MLRTLYLRELHWKFNPTHPQPHIGRPPFKLGPDLSNPHGPKWDRTGTALPAGPCFPVKRFADCYLRQGAGGTEFARNGSRTCFLRWFHKRSQAYFGQKLEEHCFPIKKQCLEVSNDDFWEKWINLKNRWSKTDFLMKFLNDSAWLCMEKLKKHSFETNKPKHLPKK